MIDLVFAALLHSLWQGALVAVLALIASRCTTDPALRHNLYGVGLLAILGLLPVTAMRMAESGRTPPLLELVPIARVGFVLLWALGTAICLTRLARSWSRPRHITRNSQAAPRSVQKMVDDLARRFGLAPGIPVLLGSEHASPSVFGWLKPVILVPGALLTKLSTAEVEALLAHEISHIARHDYVWLLLQSIAESLLFFNPAVWLLSHLMREERECACDDLAARVLGSRLRVARALVELEHLRLEPTWSPAAGGGNVASRIRRQLGMPAIVQQGWKIWSLGLAILGCLAYIFSPSSPNPTAVSAATPRQRMITIRWNAQHDGSTPGLQLQQRTLIFQADGDGEILEFRPL